MPWVKLDDRFFSHPKVIDLGKDAKLLYVSALTYCAGQLTDGEITTGALRMLCGLVDVSRDAAKALVNARLWEETKGGFKIHDYHEYNPTADEARQRQDEIKRVRSEAGKKGMAARWANREPESETEPDNKITNSLQPYVKNGSYQTDNPVPVPVLESRSDSRTSAQKVKSVSTAVAKIRDSSCADVAPNGSADTPSKATWRAYKKAYLEVYKVEPVQNAKVSSQVKLFVQRVPSADAPLMAEWFLKHRGQWYVREGHSIGSLLRDCEKLHTEWMTGITVHRKDADEIDRTSADKAMWDRVSARVDSKRNGTNETQ